MKKLEKYNQLKSKHQATKDFINEWAEIKADDRFEYKSLHFEQKEDGSITLKALTKYPQTGEIKDLLPPHSELRKAIVSVLNENAELVVKRAEQDLKKDLDALKVEARSEVQDVLDGLNA